MANRTAEDFRKNYIVDQFNKCWIWQLAAFRYRVSGSVVNPRRYAFYLHGKVIPLGRHLMPSCKNEMCCNPDHARLQHSGARVDEDTPFYLSFEELFHPPGMLAAKYTCEKSDIKSARKRTVEMIYEVKRSSIPTDRLANQYKISPGTVSRIKRMKLDEYNRIKDDPNTGLYEDAEAIDPRSFGFERP